LQPPAISGQPGEDLHSEPWIYVGEVLVIPPSPAIAVERRIIKPCHASHSNRLPGRQPPLSSSHLPSSTPHSARGYLTCCGGRLCRVAASGVRALSPVGPCSAGFDLGACLAAGGGVRGWAGGEWEGESLQRRRPGPVPPGWGNRRAGGWAAGPPAPPADQRSG